MKISNKVLFCSMILVVCGMGSCNETTEWSPWDCSMTGEGCVPEPEPEPAPEPEPSAKDCGAIAHGQNGCLQGNIVLCHDGEAGVIEGGDCVAHSQYCTPDETAESGFVCKSLDTTDCVFNDDVFAKDSRVCDGNVLRTCSEETDSAWSEGTDCADNENGEVYCDPSLNACRAYRACGESGDIAHGAVVCNDEGTDKAKCEDGTLVELTGDEACPVVENATSVCTFDTEATCSFVCNTGYTQVLDACQAIETCNAEGEIYNSESNTCVCDTANHWAGTAGSCACEDGYVPVNGQCELKTTCDANKEIYISETNTCACDTDNHWTGTAGSCACETGYVLVNGQCELKKTCDANKEIYISETNTCVCDTDNHWTGAAGSCACETGYVTVNGQCELKKTCDANKEIYNSTSNTCACDTAKHWAGTAGSCACETGYVLVNGQCELKKTCDANKEIYNSASNTCSCNTANHWIGTVGSCTCETGYLLIDGHCELKKTCDPLKEIYHASSNTCTCDTAKHWVGSAGGCMCETGVQVGSSCKNPVIGDMITFGSYEQDNDLTNGKEPITWRVLDYDSQKRIALVLSEKALDTRAFNEDNSSGCTYDRSTIRSWMNGYDKAQNDLKKDFTTNNFIDTAFTPEEQDRIAKTLVVPDKNPKADENPEYNYVTGYMTEDKIFLLSITEVNKYLPTSSDKQADTTRYAVKKGARVVASVSHNDTENGSCNDPHCWALWWLRTNGQYTTYKTYVYNSTISVNGNFLAISHMSVRPALWVKY